MRVKEEVWPFAHTWLLLLAFWPESVSVYGSDTWTWGIGTEYMQRIVGHKSKEEMLGKRSAIWHVRGGNQSSKCIGKRGGGVSNIAAANTAWAAAVDCECEEHVPGGDAGGGSGGGGSGGGGSGGGSDSPGAVCGSGGAGGGSGD